MTASALLRGLVFPERPAGAWSIAVELHFYLLFPTLLFAARWLGPLAIAASVIASVALRTAGWMHWGSISSFKTTGYFATILRA